MTKQQFPLTPQLSALSDALTEAHARIQKDFASINPVVGINRQMRASGIGADVITIECLVANKRIFIILQDAVPDMATYQFGMRDTDPEPGYEKIAIGELTSEQLYQWIRDYFQA
ncbi:hypothetical protein QWY82_08210 [Simiduia curdlanivorans]|uniref:DUF5655 domain-containing protein n=1 Tax=Simiduia curdlanivorans TaxID=1492769 RepID=A0ABV8V8A8_9GAMM|nr:hypothetical protein [Simiduia curdlanivorans]MDN3638788.1 hypothetical protein [Simiduia curdlanivorans]